MTPAPVVAPRVLSEADLAEVVVVERAAQPLPWSEAKLAEELRHADARVFGIDDDAGLAGYAAFRRLAHEVWLLNIAVRPRARRRGLARVLIDEGMRWTRALGLEELWLEVRASNKPARALYEAVGFVEEGVRPRYYPPLPGDSRREDAVLMRIRGTSR